MRTTILFFAIFLTTIFSVSAQPSVFTYQGKLTDGGAPANGTYEMRFSLFDASGPGGTPIAPVITNSAVSVVNGVFTVNLSFGSNVFGVNAERWLEIEVRRPTDPPGFTVLTPRQQIASSPFSIRAVNAGSADLLSPACVQCVTNGQIQSLDGSKVVGQLADNQISDTLTIGPGGSVNDAALPSTILRTSGGTMTGPLDMGGNVITNIGHFQTNFLAGGSLDIIHNLTVGDTATFHADIRLFDNLVVGSSLLGFSLHMPQASGAGFSLNVTGQGAGGTNNLGGHVNIRGGSGVGTGAGGNVSITGGDAIATKGKVILGNQTTSEVVVGGTTSTIGGGANDAVIIGGASTNAIDIGGASAAAINLGTSSTTAVTTAKPINGISVRTRTETSSTTPDVANISTLVLDYTAPTTVTDLIGWVQGQCVDLISKSGTNLVTINDTGVFRLRGNWVADSDEDTLTLCHAASGWTETARNNVSPPGVASISNGANFVILDGTVQTLMSKSLTAPASGYVMAIATFIARTLHTNGDHSVVVFGVSDAPGSFPSGQQKEWRIDSSTPSGGYAIPTTVHGLFEVPAAGNYTFYLLGREFSGGPSVQSMNLTLMFVPTAYGTVSRALAEPPRKNRE
jgi:hypothetical protein